MKVAVQVMTKNGNYGPNLHFKCNTVNDISAGIVAKMETLPDTIGDERLIDWIDLKIRVRRYDEAPAG